MNEHQPMVGNIRHYRVRTLIHRLNEVAQKHEILVTRKTNPCGRFSYSFPGWTKRPEVTCPNAAFAMAKERLDIEVEEVKNLQVFMLLSINHEKDYFYRARYVSGVVKEHPVENKEYIFIDPSELIVLLLKDASYRHRCMALAVQAMFLLCPEFITVKMIPRN